LHAVETPTFFYQHLHVCWPPYIDVRRQKHAIQQNQILNETVMAGLKIYLPPVSVQEDPDDLDALLDEHYLTANAQETGRQEYKQEAGDVEAQNYLDDMLHKIRSNARHIKQKLESHGDVALSRWKKYSQEKRANLLRAASSGFFAGWQQAENIKHIPLSDP
jgi:hypothetical protein